jgi:hypothetical protein
MAQQISALSPGFLYSSCELIKFIVEQNVPAQELRLLPFSFCVADTAATLAFAQDCGWVVTDLEGILRVTVDGHALYELSPLEQLREQIKRYILRHRPAWSSNIVKGRQEALLFFPAAVHQCFDEALLTQSTEADVVSFWDELASLIRGFRNMNLNETGRLGERLSISYERQRTGLDSEWISLESNLAGYDILSYTDATSKRRLRIEVKASRNLSDMGAFFLTRNEWLVALSSGFHCFHLWRIQDTKASLIVASVDDLLSHMPIECGRGSWQNVRVESDALAYLEETATIDF